MFGDKKKLAGSQIDRFLITLYTEKYILSPRHRDAQRLREQRPHGERKINMKWGNILSTCSANLPVQLKHAYSM